MIIAQITDLHIGFHGKGNPCENTQRLDIIIKSMRGLKAQPDLMLVTGDLVESGEKWAYEQLKESLAVFDFPVFMALGNHDKRENFQSVFPDVAFADGFLQYTIDNYPVRIIVLDTLEEGRHGGSFGEKRAKWLEERLSEQTDKPTILALHHPPIKTGISWMTANPNSEWVKTLEDIVSRHKHVIHMVAGHIHRSIFKKFAGTTISVCPAVAPQVKLELAELDLDKPDGRGLLVEGRPAFCLHQWDGTSITTHTGVAPCGKVLVKYDDDNADIVRHTLDIGHFGGGM